MIRNENMQQQNAEWLAWNDTQVDFPPVRCLHQLFEEQARRSPDAVAVTFGESSLTYQQLAPVGVFFATSRKCVRLLATMPLINIASTCNPCAK